MRQKGVAAWQQIKGTTVFATACGEQSARHNANEAAISTSVASILHVTAFPESVVMKRIDSSKIRTRLKALPSNFFTDSYI
jgi:hypothetical protein